MSLFFILAYCLIGMIVSMLSYEQDKKLYTTGVNLIASTITGLIWIVIPIVWLFKRLMK